MKKILLITITLISTNIFSQLTREDFKQFETYNAISEKLRELNPQDVQGYIDVYFNTVFKFIVLDKSVWNEPEIRLIVKQNDLKFRFEYFNDRIIAMAESPLNGDDTIIVDPDKWVKLTNVQRLWLISHEIAHESFGIDHSQGGALMFPLLPTFEKDIADFKSFHAPIEGGEFTVRFGKQKGSKATNSAAGAKLYVDALIDHVDYLLYNNILMRK